MLSTKTAARTLVALVVASLAAIALTATASGADATTIRIWTDKDRLAAVTKVANAWAASRARRSSRAEGLRSDPRQPEDRPGGDGPRVIVGAHDWIGELSANGSIVPLFPSTATKQFPATPSTRSRTAAIKKLGAPVAGYRPHDEHEAQSRPPGRSSRHRRSRRRRRRRRRSPFRPAGRGRRRVPHARLLGPLQLHLWQERRGQPRPVEHRHREPEVHEERRADRPVEQTRPDPPSVDSSISRDLFLQARPRSGSPGRGTSACAQEVRPVVLGLVVPDDRRRRLQVGAVPRRAGLHGHEVRPRTHVEPAKTSSRTT